MPPVKFEEDCYTWCNLASSGQGDSDAQFKNAVDSFSRCLSTGDNSSAPSGMVCGEGSAAQESSSPATTIVNAAVSQTSIDAVSTPTESSGAQRVSASGHAKMAGLTGVLLVAGMAAHGV